jgi:hypothetical protein
MDTRSLRRRVAIVGALAIGVVIVHAACGGSSVPVTPKYPYWLIGSSASPSGGGTESLDPDGTTDSTGVTSYFCSMTKDLIVEITAHPAEGYVFDHWGMDCKVTPAPANPEYPASSFSARRSMRRSAPISALARIWAPPQGVATWCAT